MNPEEFRRYGHEIIDWVAQYMESVEEYPVMSRTEPGDIRKQLPENPPVQGEAMEAVLNDFKDIIIPGITHWNHPRFFGYFPANNSGPSILAELLSAALGVNGMVWQTSPAATELEEVVMDWLRRMLSLPDEFRGVIQDTASTATICALLCAREKSTGYSVNTRGMIGNAGLRPLRIYTSSEGHSSIEKGAKIAGFGAQNVVKVASDEAFAMDTRDLRQKIIEDLSNGFQPCCVTATVGTTSSTALDPLSAIGDVCLEFDLWLHVDAALAGSAAILPEKRWILEGIEKADSFVFNPHKWLFTNFDCSAFFCREPETLTRVMSIQPEYLKTARDREVTNYRDWGIQLGRRFRALKLWFVIRNFGVEGLREKIREHLSLAQEFRTWIEGDDNFQLMAPVPLNTLCFRFQPKIEDGESGPEAVDSLNQAIMDEINARGKIFLTHTRLNGRFCLRISIGQTETGNEHVRAAWDEIRNISVFKNRG